MSTNSKWEPPRINSGSELALRAENERLNRIAMEHYKRLLGDAQEEIARLQSGIAALRERWQARRDAWKSEFDEEMNKRGYTAYAAILGGEWYATESVLEELDALFPPEVICALGEIEPSNKGDV